jgi:hypothetical protein
MALQVGGVFSGHGADKETKAKKDEEDDSSDSENE